MVKHMFVNSSLFIYCYNSLQPEKRKAGLLSTSCSILLRILVSSICKQFRPLVNKLLLGDIVQLIANIEEVLMLSLFLQKIDMK